MHHLSYGGTRSKNLTTQSRASKKGLTGKGARSCDGCIVHSVGGLSKGRVRVAFGEDWAEAADAAAMCTSMGGVDWFKRVTGLMPFTPI
jgi:hypothetical protein